jgi:hypothetical protein
MEATPAVTHAIQYKPGLKRPCSAIPAIKKVKGVSFSPLMCIFAVVLAGVEAVDKSARDKRFLDFARLNCFAF